MMMRLAVITKLGHKVSRGTTVCLYKKKRNTAVSVVVVAQNAKIFSVKERFCVFVTLSILQSQFIEKGFKKAENCEQNVVLLLFLFTLEIKEFSWLIILA